MNLIEKLYQKDEAYLQKIWDTFVFFDPKVPYLRYKFIRKALEEKNKEFFTNLIRNSFYPHQFFVEQEFRHTINIGIKAINNLGEEYLGEDYNHFRINYAPNPLNLFELVHTAREELIESKQRSGERKQNPRLLSKAYDKIRACGLGYYVLVVQESPELRYAISEDELVLSWFKDKFGFFDKKISGELSNWKTNAGVKIYGEDNPFRYRLKVLNENGEPKYSSILMKMFLKTTFPNKIEDYTGIEFIVENEQERKNLIHYLQAQLSPTGKIEGFDKKQKDKKKSNVYSSSNFEVTKFIVRPPVPTKPIKEFGSFMRIPVEVQILTIDEHIKRKEDPDAEHSTYKKRQFMKLFPVLFPRQIYEPIL